MTYEDFLKECSFDISEGEYVDEMQVVCIFSTGFLKTFDENFTKANPDVVKSLVAHDLYDYMRERWKV